MKALLATTQCVSLGTSCSVAAALQVGRWVILLWCIPLVADDSWEDVELHELQNFASTIYRFGNLNSDTFWMILQFQYPFCHCVVTSSRHVRQRIPRKPAPDTPLICLLLEALGLRGEAGPFDWLRTSGVTLWPGDLVCPQILMTFRVNALSFRASDLDSNQRQQEIRLLVLYLPWCNLLFACQYGFNIYLGSDSFWFIARATSEPASLAQRGFQLEVWDFCWGTVGIFNFGKPVKFPCRIYHWNTSSYVDLS